MIAPGTLESQAWRPWRILLKEFKRESEIARACGITRAAIEHWRLKRRIPPIRAAQLSAVARIPIRHLAPDLSDYEIRKLRQSQPGLIAPEVAS